MQAQPRKVNKMHPSKRADNTYRLHCVPQERVGASYAVCLNIIHLAIRKLPDGQSLLGDRFKDCQECINSRTCPAIAMLQQEKQAGKALYYIPYVHPEGSDRPLKVVPSQESEPDRQSESYKRGYNMKPFQSGVSKRPTPQNPQTSKSVSKAKPASSIVTYDAAELVAITQESV